MALDILAELLGPYRSALAGEEMDRQDPIYGTLFPDLSSESASEGQGRQGAPMGPPGSVEEMVKRMAARQYGWTGEQWRALDELVSRESGWNPQADNPTSTAYGLFQFLDSTRENYGIGLNASPRAQARAGLRYVHDRYDSPLDAIAFHDRNNYY